LPQSRLKQRVLDAPDEATARAAELRERVARLFTVSAMTEQILDFYRTAPSVTR